MARVLGFHFILSAYGFWLPNDPRGSWSDTVREYELLRFGPATKTTITRSVASRPHDRAVRLAAKAALRHRPVTFTGTQARAIARGFAVAASEHTYNIHALAVMPDHVHLVMAWHTRSIEQIAAHLKAKATHQLRAESLHPFAVDRTGRLTSPWARGFWCPFLWSDTDLRRANRYVNNNPPRAGLKPQHWNLVAPYSA